MTVSFCPEDTVADPVPQVLGATVPRALGELQQHYPTSLRAEGEAISWKKSSRCDEIASSPYGLLAMTLITEGSFAEIWIFRKRKVVEKRKAWGGPRRHEDDVRRLAVR